MATSPLALSFTINAQTAAAIQQVQAFQRQLAGLQGVKQIPDPTKQVTSGLAGLAGSFGPALAGFAALSAAAIGVKAALSRGFAVNAELEDSKLGITGLIAAMAEVRDESGKVVTGQEAIGIASGIAAEQMDKIRVAAMKTTSTAKELASAYQAALSSGLGVGFDPNQVLDLTVGLVQAAGVMGIAADQMKSEINALFSGDINPDADLAKKLGISREQVDKWRAAGPIEFYDELNKRLTVYKLLGDEAGKTWSGTLSSAADAADLFFGKMTEGAYSKVKTAIQNALKAAFDPKTMGIDKSLDGIVDAGSAAFDGLGTVMADAISGAVSLAKDLSGWFDKHQAQVLEVSNTFGVIYENVKSVVSSITTGVGLFAGFLVDAGAVKGVFGSIAIVVALIRDGLQLWKGIFADIGGYILDKVGGPLRTVLGGLRDLLSAIPGIGTGLADSIDKLLRSIPANGAALHKVASDIQADFDAGRTAVAQTNRELSRTPAQLKAIADANARVRDSQNPKKKSGSAGGKASPKDASKEAKAAAEAYAAALRAYADAEVAAQKKVSQSLKELAETELAKSLQDRLISQENYLNQKAALDKKALAEERVYLKRQADLLKNDIDAEQKDPAKKKKLEGDLRKVEAELKALDKKVVVIDTKLAIDQEAFRREIENLQIDIKANIMDLEGNPLGSASAKLKKEIEDLMNDPRVKGKADMEALVTRQGQLKQMHNDFTEQKRLSDDRVATLSLAEERIAFEVEQGQKTAIEGERAVREERLKTAEAILEQVKSLEKLAAANKPNLEMGQTAAKARLEYEKLKGTLDATATSINGELAGSLTGIVESMGKGQSAIASIGAALSDVFGNLAKRVLKQFENELFTALQGSSGQGLGGMLSQLFGGGSGAGGGASFFGSFAKLFGFAGGGYTGAGGRYDPAGIVHKNEYVFTSPEVNKKGPGWFYAMKRHINTGSPMPGYADGGLVGGGFAGAAAAFSPSYSPTIQNQNTVAISSDDMLHALASHPDFARTITKVVIANSGKIGIR